MSPKFDVGQDGLALEVHPLTLAFDPGVERQFMDEYFKKSLGQIRLTILIGALFYSVFAFLDLAAAPAFAKPLLTIRFGVLLPLSAVVYGLTYLGLFRRIWQGALSFWILVAGLGIVAMIGIVQGEARNSYYAGLIMVFIVLYTWTRVRFVWATMIGWLIVAAYEILTVGFLHVSSQLVLTHNFFFIGSNLLGMLACYSIERYARQDFFMTRLLRAEQDKVQRTNQALTTANEELKRLAQIDDLTKIPNRRMFDQDLKRGWRRAAREGRPLSLLIGDVDYFKSYNDSHGHQAGDDCLAKVALAVAGAARRPGDFAARYGGDEFAILLLDTNLDGAIRVAEGLCHDVFHMKIPHGASPVSSYVSLSVGVASLAPSPQRGPDDLVRKADECLYQAKAQGRNRVVAPKA